MTLDADAFADPPGLDKELRICPECGKSRLPSAFFSANSVRCKNCTHSKTTRIRTLKSALIEMSNRQIVAATRGDRIDAPRISQVCARMIELFGGMNGFCQKWYDNIAAACEKNPGGVNALNQLRAIAKLVRDSTTSIDSASAYANLSDEELEEHYKHDVELEAMRIVNESVSQQLIAESEEISEEELDADLGEDGYDEDEDLDETEFLGND